MSDPVRQLLAQGAVGRKAVGRVYVAPRTYDWEVETFDGRTRSGSTSTVELARTEIITAALELAKEKRDG